MFQTRRVGGSQPHAAATMGDRVREGSAIDPVFLALQRFNRRQYDECITLCSELLANNPYDQAVWYLKCRALTMLNWIDDTDFEEEGVAEVLLDENATAALPRPGTSLSRPMTQAAHRMTIPLRGWGRGAGGLLRDHFVAQLGP